MTTMMEMEIKRINRWQGEGATRAFCDLVIAGTFLIKGLRVVEGKNGTFVSMPRRQGANGQWYEMVTPLSDDVKAHLSEIVLEAYNDLKP